MHTATPADLTKLEFFKGLSANDLTQLAGVAFLKRINTGETFFYEGAPLEPALRFVFEGGLQIRKTASSGKETVLRLIRPGELFGVAVLFDRKFAPGSAIATEPTTILEIRLADAMTFFSQNPELTMKLLITFAQRLRDSQDTLHTIITSRAKARLARQILSSLKHVGGEVVPEGIKLKTKLPHATLSRMIGITYEECVRLIREWSIDPAILHYERGGSLIILDQAALERLAAEE